MQGVLHKGDAVSTAARISAVTNELRAIKRGIPENRADPATMQLLYWLEQAAIRSKRAQDLCGEIAQTPLSGRTIKWDSL